MLTRRDFLKTAAIGGAGFAAMGLAGCGSSSDSSSASETTESSFSAAGETTADVGSTEAASGPKEITLPLTDEAVTLSIWMPAVSSITENWGDYNNVPFFQEMEERTGVHIDFITPATGEETTAFNLMIVSGELTDIIVWPNYYSEGYDAAIEDGYYLELSPYLDTCLSNYNAIRTTDETWVRDSTTDSGNIAIVLGLKTTPQGAWGGLQIREDWLEDLGLDMPVTYDDLEEVLTAFKDQKEAYAPLALASHGNYWYGEMSAGFGVTDALMNKEGTVVAGFATDEWREYLTLMNDWYKKGLIDPDFMTDSSWMVDTELVTSGASGVWWSMYTYASYYEATDENMLVTALASPKLNASDVLHIRMQDTSTSNGVAISADCEHPEIAMKWLDYLFTEEGSNLANYGIEGLTYEVVDGEIQLTDYVLNNEDGMSAGTVLMGYGLTPDKIPSYYDWTRELGYVPEKDLKAYDIWGAEDHLDDWCMPSGVTLTNEESVERASMYTDIQTFYQEASCQFITGVLDISSDEDWEYYISTIEGMGLDRCVEITQAALDRYYAR